MSRASIRGWSLVAAGASALLAAPAAGQGDPPGTAHPDLWPRLEPGRLIHPETEAFVDKLLASMTLEEKVGQMIQADIDSITPEDLETYRLGSLLAGGDAAPGGDVRAPASAWLAMVDTYARAALKAPGDRHRPIPILFGIDAVHGDAKIRGATIFPHNIGLGAAHDPALLRRIGAATAEEVATTGIDWTFAPTVAVVRDPRWGRTYESYSEDPAEVRDYAGAMVAGIQGEAGTTDFLAPRHTLSSVKHFLGDGGTADGRDQGDNRSSEPELARIHGAGYGAAIEAGAMIVMASYSAWQGVKMHANRGLLTDVLKGRLGFDGFLIGDWNAQEEIPGCTKFDCPTTILAGLDMVMAADSWKGIYRNTLDEVRAGRIPEARIDDAVRRILRVKALAGLFDRPGPKDRQEAGHFEDLGSAAHRALAREAVRKSLVLLKNENHVLPLSPRARILVTGPGADDIGMQAGGWTVDWQGNKNTNADFPGATSIYAGIAAAVQAAGGTASLSPDGHFDGKPDAAIVVFGEKPYAEFEGDRETLEYSPGDRRDLDLLKRLRAAHIPVVAVFLSGRPLWVNPELNAADAFVAAWLPGSEGEGVADLLFRDAAGGTPYDFTGRLSFSWPRTGMPVTLDTKDEPTGALFRRGYGLTYGAKGDLAPLPEDPAIPADRRDRETLFAAGHPTAPWSLYVDDGLAGVRITTARQASPEGAVEASLADGILHATWAGGKPGTLNVGQGRSVDLTARSKAGDAIAIRLRLDASPQGPVGASIVCGKHCRGDLDLTPALRAATPGTWTVIELPLACFAAKGADLAETQSPLLLSSEAPLRLDIAEIRFVRGHGGKCPG